MSEQQSQITSKYAALQRKAQRLIGDINLSEVTRDITDIAADLVKLPDELQRLRSRKYIFAAYLEQKI